MLNDLRAQHEEYVQWNNQHRDEYQNKTDEFADAYDAASQEAKQAFKKDIMELFNKFREAFEESNNQYISMMNNLTGALYSKVASVKQHSMVQRSMIMNLYQDFCDGVFYFSFTDCYADDYVPTMSDRFDTMLIKLKNIEWDGITSMETPGLPERFDNVRINLVDKHMPGFNSSSQTYGAATSLRETGEVQFNIDDYESWLDEFYRVRIDSFQVLLLDKSIPPNVYLSSEEEVIGFTIYFPLEFMDKDAYENVYSFRGIGHTCTSAYFIENGDIVQISSCKIDEEFDGVNHQTSHNGMYKIKVKNVPQNILDEIGGIRIVMGGSYATFDYEMDAVEDADLIEKQLQF